MVKCTAILLSLAALAACAQEGTNALPIAMHGQDVGELGDADAAPDAAANPIEPIEPGDAEVTDGANSADTGAGLDAAVDAGVDAS